MLHPANWSMTVRRVLFASVAILNIGLLATGFALGSKGVEAHRLTLIRITIPVLLVDFLVVWVAVGVDQGFRKGFLIALGFLISALAASFALDAIIH